MSHALADKLRTLADSLAPAIADKFRDRLSNTPKRQREAGKARQEGRDLERAQAIMRALADRHEAGTVPACLAGVTTKAALVELAREGVDYSRGGYYSSGDPMGAPALQSPAAKVEQAAAAWALLKPADPAELAAEALRQKVDALRFAKIPGYFPTPAGLVARMIDAAQLAPGSRVLEPSAGCGRIADALRDAGHRVDCVERHLSLQDILRAKGHSVIADDFAEFGNVESYDAVLMNPPFERGQDVEHVQRALMCLRPGGVLVAIMGAGVSFRKERRYADFRDQVAELGGEFEDVPASTFKESGTGVASVMLTIRTDAAPALASPVAPHSGLAQLVDMPFAPINKHLSEETAREVVALRLAAPLRPRGAATVIAAGPDLFEHAAQMRLF